MQNVFFCDIETVSQFEKWDEVPEPLKSLFISRFDRDIIEVANGNFQGQNPVEVVWKRKAALHAEFGNYRGLGTRAERPGKGVISE